MNARDGAVVGATDFRPHREAAAVRRMFADIAPTYDFLNHFLSANVDRSWRRAAIRMAELRGGERVLDVCCGTGDLAIEAARTLHAAGGGRVYGTDFCPEMVRRASRKTRRPGSREVELGVADTLRLPFATGSFDVVTVGFGIRNVAVLVDGLIEMLRVLRPRGRAVVLEFTTPRSTFFRRVFGVYFNRVLPRLGRWLSAAPRPDVDDAYRYLPDSVSRFPDAEGLRDCMERAGFVEVRYRSLSFGIAAVHVGAKP